VRFDSHPAFSGLILTVFFCGLSVAAEPASGEAGGTTVRFDRDIRPILSDKCFFCHGPDPQHREADLRLDIEAEAKASAIVPGDADASDLIARIRSTDADEIMPPPAAHKELSPEEIDLLTRWVSEGAAWTQHWSFIPPVAPPIPASSPTDPVQGAIDAFVVQRLQQEGRKLSAEADREKLIRRVTFDLTGLPPTLAEIDAFVSDTSNDAYEKVVDRLLQSHHYGERMALMWMDAARYGDTSVYHADGPRDMWAWRDAVVEAYNQNLPFDDFSISQLAGDLVPGATLQRQVLAGFNRNNGTTDEGGAFAEEYRVEYAVDRVKTTSTVWLGLTMECAQCHDHKYDPVSQEEYYRFYAFFNVSRDGGMQTRKGNAQPTLEIPDPEKQEKLAQLQQQIDAVNQQLKEKTASCQPAFVRWLEAQQQSGGDDPVLNGAVVNVSLVEGSGDSISDLADPSRKGKLHGKVQWVKSRHDWGLQFSGDNYVDLGSVGDFERTDSFSYGGWVKPQKRQTGALLARMDDNNQHRGYDMLVGDGQISVHIIHQWPGNAIKVITNKKLQADKWQHVMATYDGSSKAAGIAIYVDGEKWDWRIEQDGLSQSIKTDKSLLIGSRHPGSRLKGSVDQVQVFASQLAQADVQRLAKTAAIAPLLAIDAAERTDEQTKSLRDYYLASEDQQYREWKKQLESFDSRRAELDKPLTTVMIMGDMEKPRETFVLNRGAYDSPTDKKVEAGTLSILPPMSNDAPRNRLGMARWLFHADHPLTARVAVNRYWQMLFGVGLVATPEDFGAQGDYPSHPELLDWLATDFRDSGWNVKRMIKQIVMSTTYRQSSAAAEELYRRDPDNRLLARGPRFRLQGEFIRDNALAVGGLLVSKVGGPGVKPYQPPGLWAEVGLGGNPKFVQDHGDKLYRRSLYTYWKRSAPPPSMQIFDAPTREKCTIRRARTNTPLQALTTLNDVQFVEASRHFAQRLMREGGKAVDQRVRYAFRLATARQPSPGEVAVLTEIHDAALQQYQGDADAATALLAVGESDRDDSLQVAEHAAWTIVASAILNLDETLTRE
jgi:hypothetical protein